MRRRPFSPFRRRYSNAMRCVRFRENQFDPSFQNAQESSGPRIPLECMVNFLDPLSESGQHKTQVAGLTQLASRPASNVVIRFTSACCVSARGFFGLGFSLPGQLFYSKCQHAQSESSRGLLCGRCISTGGVTHWNIQCQCSLADELHSILITSHFFRHRSLRSHLSLTT